MKKQNKSLIIILLVIILISISSQKYMQVIQIYFKKQNTQKNLKNG